MTQFTYLPDWRWIAAVGVVALATVFLSYRWARGRAGQPVRLFLTSVRCAILALLAACLLDPNWVEKIQHQPKARMAVLLDTSRSMGTQDVPGGRLKAGKDWVEQHVLSDKPANLEVGAFRFDQVVASMKDFNAASPTGSVTALANALETLLAAPADDPLTGVVLVSDGIETSSKAPEAVARQFRQKGIPIHTVTTGTTNDLKDIVIENVQVKRAVPNESPTRVTLALRSTGFSNQTVSVVIRRDREALTTKEVRLNGAAQQVELDFTPRQRGFQVYEVSVSPQRDEWLATNNRRQFGLEVTDPTLRVLYMEGTPQQDSSPIPEWKYLKDALQSDKDLKVTVLYRQVGNGGQFLNTVDSDPETGDRIYPVEHPTKGFPRTLAGLLEYDVVIHSDIKISSFTPDQLLNVSKLVEQFGGGFVMIGGNSAFGKGGYHRTVLDRIIPVAMESSDDSEARPIRLQVPTAAWTHPLIAFSDDRAETVRIWTEKFPTLYGMNRVERAKPGAVVLAKADDGNVLIAVQEIGKGRSMAFTSDTTRTWGRDFETIWGEASAPGRRLTESNSDSRYYRQFWVNAVRWLAAGKVSKTNSAVTLELAQGYAQPGESVKASVKVRNPQLQEIATAEVSLQFAGAPQSNAIVRARYDSASRTYEANIPVPSAGSHVLVASATQRGVKLGEDRQLLVGESSDREMEDLRARPESMAAIARVSGGQAYQLDSAPAAPGALFAQVPPGTVEYRRRPLWDKPWWLGTILGFLTLEWAVRRWRGLA
ncbi:MAG TPA: glutamine amidotransferase [Verrucomicrobiota bacterium]|nr:hypothetical protein [Verrucomicrobiales bacterium]HRI15559.1 glutamine amidotransferase [Verrucomicrobiota bacterium]